MTREETMNSKNIYIGIALFFAVSIYFFSRYLLYFSYDMGLEVQNNKLSGTEINMHSGWFPSLNTGDDGVYLSFVSLFYDLEGNKTLVFKKPYVTHIGNVREITFVRFQDFDKTYSSAEKKNMFDKKIEFPWGDLDILNSGVINGNQVAAFFKKEKLVIYASSIKDFEEISSIRKYTRSEK